MYVYYVCTMQCVAYTIRHPSCVFMYCVCLGYQESHISGCTKPPSMEYVWSNRSHTRSVIQYHSPPPHPTSPKYTINWNQQQFKLCLIPRALPSFTMLHAERQATLKSCEGPGNEAKLNLLLFCTFYIPLHCTEINNPALAQHAFIKSIQEERNVRV